VCPLCLRGFSREALAGREGHDPVLTLAHVIPKKLGGTICTLACKDCNNGVGTELEAVLMQRFATEDFASGHSPINARVNTPLGDLGVEMELSPNRSAWSMRVIDKQSDPKVVQATQSGLPKLIEKQEAFRFTLTLPYPHLPRHIEAAIYQSAYLLMFRQFGYEFVSHPHFAKMRERIVNPKETTWKTPIMIPGEGTVALLGEQSYAIMLIREPSSIMALLRFRRKEGQQKVLAVFLPGLDSPDVPTPPSGSFQGDVIGHPPEVFLETQWSLHQLWHYLRQQGI
jgi:hypothetical protein